MRQQILQRGRHWIRHELPSTNGKSKSFGCFFHIIKADDLIGIRLLEQGTVAEFVERHAERWVRVQSPGIVGLQQPLEQHGATIEVIDDTTWHVRGCDSRTIGELAAAHSVVLYELSPQTGSLEDAFLQVTAAAQEFRSANIDGAA